jgi:hypothetical protein
VSKNEALRQIADETAASDEMTRRILAQRADALKAYTDFTRGYLAFHAEAKRYRLDELKT